MNKYDNVTGRQMKKAVEAIGFENFDYKGNIHFLRHSERDQIISVFVSAEPSDELIVEKILRDLQMEWIDIKIHL